MAQLEEIAGTIKSFILEHFLPQEDPDELADDTELTTTGILDSVSTLRVILFLEEEYGIQVEASEANIEHFNTIDAMSRLVASKL